MSILRLKAVQGMDAKEERREKSDPYERLEPSTSWPKVECWSNELKGQVVFWAKKLKSNLAWKRAYDVIFPFYSVPKFLS